LSVKLSQFAISSLLRAQPIQKSEEGRMRHTPMQGLGIISDTA
jgi:hypothetical protein